jgi:hypothetical protein
MGNHIACCRQTENDKPIKANDLINYSNVAKQEGSNENVIIANNYS